MTHDTTATIPTWVRERLDKLENGKSDRGVMKSEIKRIEERIDDVEDKALDHMCAKEGDIREMQSTLAATAQAVSANTEETKKMYRWYVRGLAALVLFLITSGVGFVWYLAGMAFHLEAQGAALEKIELRLDNSPTKAEEMQSIERIVEDAVDRAAAATADRAIKQLKQESSSSL